MICDTLDGKTFDCDIYYVDSGIPAERPDAISLDYDKYGTLQCFDQLNKVSVKISPNTEEYKACVSILSQYVIN